MYILDTQEKTDLRNTNRFLLSHEKLRGFRLSGRAWTFSSTVCVDLPCDVSEDLVEIARGKFMEAEGDSERPDGIEYLSVHCDKSPLVLGSTTEAQLVLFSDFSKLPTQAGIPCGNVCFLTSKGLGWL